MNNSYENESAEPISIDIAAERSGFKKTVLKLAVFGVVNVINNLFLIWIFIYPFSLAVKHLNGQVSYELLYFLNWLTNDLCVYFFPILTAYLLFRDDFSKRKRYNNRYEFQPLSAIIIFLSSIFVGSLATIITNVIAEIFDKLFGTGEIPDAMEGTMPPQGEMGSYVIAMFFLVIAAPVCEELLVRGILLQGLRKHGEGFAIVTTALIFGFIHGNLDQLPYAFAVGLLYGLLAVRSNSVIPSMILHSFNNLLVALSSYLTQITGETEPALSIQQWVGSCMSFCFWLGILATVLLFAAKLHKLSKAPLAPSEKAKELFKNPGMYIFVISLAALMIV